MALIGCSLEMIILMMDLLGWLGAALLLIPYSLVSTGKISGESKIFQTSNIVGSVFLTANSLFYGAFPSVFVNLVWIAIGVITLIKLNMKKVVEDVSI